MSDSPDPMTTPSVAAGPGVAQAAAASAAAAEATRPDAKPDGQDTVPAGSKDAAGPGETQKPAPARPAAEIRADIVRERAALGASFDALRTDLDDAVDAGRQRAANVGRKAKIAAPVVGAAIFVALFLRSRARDRR